MNTLIPDLRWTRSRMAAILTELLSIHVNSKSRRLVGSMKHYTRFSFAVPLDVSHDFAIERHRLATEIGIKSAYIDHLSIDIPNRYLLD